MKNYSFIKKLCIYLLATVFICYGLAAFILQSSDIKIRDLKNLNIKFPNNISISDNFYNNSYQVNDTKTESLEGINTIIIELSSPDVTILPYKENDLKVEIEGNIKSSNSILPQELDVHKDGDSLWVKFQSPNFVGVFSYSMNVNLNVYLPENYKNNIEIKVSSSDIKASNLTLNELKVISSSGDSEFENLSVNKLNYSSSSGEVYVKDLKSKENIIRTTSGKIELNNLTGSLTSTSSSGDTSIIYSEFNENNLDLSSSSGDIHLSLPKNSEFNINAKTSSGDINFNTPIKDVVKKGKHSISAVVGNSKNNININTSSGDIEIR